MNSNKYHHHSGQAATEFVIAAVFVLVPLFLIIPLIGKYIDIRHSLVQQARYEAWEYTVWYGPGEKKMHGLEDEENAGRKSWAKTRDQALKYYFSSPFDSNYGSRQAAIKANPLWVDHRNESLFKKPLPEVSGSQKEQDTPDPIPGGFFNKSLKVINWITSTYGELLSHLKKDGGDFDAIYTKGFYTSNPRVEVRSIGMILPEMTLSQIKYDINAKPLTMEAKASVLSNYWSSGSTSQAINESKGLVFSGILAPVTDLVNTIIGTLNKVFSIVAKVLPIDFKLPLLPKFGFVKEDLVPYEHLDESDSDKNKPHKHELKKTKTLYYYKEK